jgi:hypothetical protein
MLESDNAGIFGSLLCGFSFEIFAAVDFSIDVTTGLAISEFEIVSDSSNFEAVSAFTLLSMKA